MTAHSLEIGRIRMLAADPGKVTERTSCYEAYEGYGTA